MEFLRQENPNIKKIQENLIVLDTKSLLSYLAIAPSIYFVPRHSHFTHEHFTHGFWNINFLVLIHFGQLIMTNVGRNLYPLPLIYYAIYLNHKCELFIAGRAQWESRRVLRMVSAHHSAAQRALRGKRSRACSEYYKLNYD